MFPWPAPTTRSALPTTTTSDREQLTWQEQQPRNRRPKKKVAAKKTPAKKAAAPKKAATLKAAAKKKVAPKKAARKAKVKTGDVDYFLKADGLDTSREKEIGQHIGYRYDVNLVPDYDRLTPFLAKYMEVMGWDDLNWLEDVHMGYEEGNAAVFDRNANGWIRIPKKNEAAEQPAGSRHDCA